MPVIRGFQAGRKLLNFTTEREAAGLTRGVFRG